MWCYHINRLFWRTLTLLKVVGSRSVDKSVYRMLDLGWCGIVREMRTNHGEKYIIDCTHIKNQRPIWADALLVRQRDTWRIFSECPYISTTIRLNSEALNMESNKTGFFWLAYAKWSVCTIGHTDICLLFTGLFRWISWYF